MLCYTERKVPISNGATDTQTVAFSCSHAYGVLVNTHSVPPMDDAHDTRARDVTRSWGMSLCGGSVDFSHDSATSARGGSIPRKWPPVTIGTRANPAEASVL